MDLQRLWERLISLLRDELEAEETDVWFSSARPLRLDAGKLYVEFGNGYYVDWVVHNYLAVMRELSPKVFDQPLDFVFEVADKHTGDEPRAVRPAHTGLNARQTFDTFVVGECNRLVHAASQAVVDRPAVAYNPLYIYGSTGLGKTHLMHAIGNEIARRHPKHRVVYVTTEDFVNEMINAIRAGKTEKVRARYRDEATVLLVDDIQFLQDKERTQEEFFHTFNALVAAGKQIVLTSDVEPKELTKLEPRLRTRFEAGLIADISAPDYETLRAILQHKAEEKGFTLPDDLAHAIAEVAQGNVRELEGVINRLSALERVFRQPLTLPFAREKLPMLFSTEASVVTVAAIIEAVAKFHNLKSADITGKKRTRALTDPRHVAMYVARVHSKMSFPELGREFGDRDHTTVQHGFRKVEAELATDPDLAHQVRLIEQNLRLRTR